MMTKEQRQAAKEACEKMGATTGQLYSALAELDAKDAEIERLRGVVKDFEDQIINRRRQDEASARLSGKPQAWIVECPRGHEFDSLVFPAADEAELQAEEFNGDCPEGQEVHVAVPLYALSASSTPTERHP